MVWIEKLINLYEFGHPVRRVVILPVMPLNKTHVKWTYYYDAVAVVNAWEYQLIVFDIF